MSVPSVQIMVSKVNVTCKQTIAYTKGRRLDPRGGEGTPLYKLYRYVPPQRVWFLGRFGLKTGIEFDHHGLFRVWFSRETRERINVFVFSTPNE